jgi:hypothetical protein
MHHEETLACALNRTAEELRTHGTSGRNRGQKSGVKTENGHQQQKSKAGKLGTLSADTEVSGIRLALRPTKNQTDTGFTLAAERKIGGEISVFKNSTE